jgi:hypothetical protein
MKTGFGRTYVAIVLLVLVAVVACDTTESSSTKAVEYEPIPSSILTPNRVESRLGPLTFFDGYPSAETVDAVYDNLDFQRGVRAFLDGLPIASLHAMREGLREVGCVNGTVGIFETLMDARTLFLTANTESVYAVTWLDLTDGPMVVESAPNTLGILDDFWFGHVTDLGNAGPDGGQGGKFLILPPGYDGEAPDGYHTFTSRTFGNWLIWRGFLEDGDPQPAVANLKAHTRIYPLAQRDAPPATEFVNLSGRPFNTIHANDLTFYEEVHAVLQEEPVDALDPEFLGLLAAIGIEKGKPFAPDARMTEILTDAAAVGNATARALVFATRDPASYYYENSAWKTGFIGGSHEFEVDGVRLLDGRTLFFYYATGITPAMAAKMVGIGSQYAGAMVDSEGRALDGGYTYRLRMPPDVPVKDFWSLVLYDNQTRSMLQTDQPFPSLNSERGVEQNDDGSTDVYFGPTRPPATRATGSRPSRARAGASSSGSMVRSTTGSTRRGNRARSSASTRFRRVVPTDARPAMATDIPASITTPDRVETRIGTLEFFDGFPTPATVDLVYEQPRLPARRGGLPLRVPGRVARGDARRHRYPGCRSERRHLDHRDAARCAGALPDTQHRERLHRERARPACGSGRRREPAQHPGHGQRPLLPLRVGHGQCRARSWRGRQVSLPAAGLGGRRAGGLLHLPLADLHET